MSRFAALVRLKTSPVPQRRRQPGVGGEGGAVPQVTPPTQVERRPHTQTVETTYSGVTDPDYRQDDHIAAILNLHFPGMFQCGCGAKVSSDGWAAHVAPTIGALQRADARLEAHSRHVHVAPSGAR